MPKRERLDYWVGAIAEGLLELRASSAHRDFDGELLSASLGPIGVNSIKSDPLRVWRTKRDIGRSRESYFYLIGNQDSPWRVSVAGREANMRPGDFVLTDSREAGSLEFPISARSVSLQLPVSWVECWLAEPHMHLGLPFLLGDPGWRGALAAFAQPWHPDLALANPLPAEMMGDQLGALLSLACENPRRIRTDHQLHTKVREALRERFAEPGLTAAQVASALGCSVRSLHRAVASRGDTFAAMLQAQRMAVARLMLQSQTLRGLTTAEIARRVGFLDSSHFARVCRRHFGLPPSALRLR